MVSQWILWDEVGEIFVKIFGKILVCFTNITQPSPIIRSVKGTEHLMGVRFFATITVFLQEAVIMSFSLDSVASYLSSVSSSYGTTATSATTSVSDEETATSSTVTSSYDTVEISAEGRAAMGMQGPEGKRPPPPPPPPPSETETSETSTEEELLDILLAAAEEEEEDEDLLYALLDGEDDETVTNNTVADLLTSLF